ncbi:hypothetical protein ANTQUA_LOCUS1804 [Anthophora quadrimaculata]
MIVSILYVSYIPTRRNCLKWNKCSHCKWSLVNEAYDHLEASYLMLKNNFNSKNGYLHFISMRDNKLFYLLVK